MWNVQSGDLMKATQDRAMNPMTAAEMEKYCQAVKELGGNLVALATPYDTPTGAPDTVQVLVNLCTIARKYGLKVWHRHSWLSDEGWYSTSKDISKDRLQDIKNWIITNGQKYPVLFETGDLFTPKPEPQNMGVAGMNGNTPFRFGSVAIFNKWLRDAITVSDEAFAQLGKTGVKTGYYGFDGFVVCGYGNPDWTGKSFLEQATVDAMKGIITADHYPSLVGKPMTDFLAVFKKTWPNAKIIMGEYGAAQLNTDAEIISEIQNSMNVMKADPVVVGVNYWHMGPGGTEALLNSDFTHRPAFDEVKKFFTSGVTPTPPPPTDTDHVELLKAMNAMVAALDTHMETDQLKDLIGKAKVILWGTASTATKVTKLKALMPN